MSGVAALGAAILLGAVRVLIVEDERKVAKALREGLEAEHYAVRVASTGEEGFFLVNHEAFDLVVLDLMLPRRDGLEVLTTLRRRGLQTPVLILTAKDTVDDRVRGLDSGADDYLVKPFAFPELLARIRALLRRGRPDQVLKTLSRLEAAFEQLRRFTADASHELRTPLTAIRSVGEVALQRSLSAPGYREVIGSMLEEVDRLTRLVESLLTLTRGESGRIQPVVAVVNLRELMTSVVEHLRVLAEEKEQGLTIQAAPDVSATCDPAILRQALVNVLDNAIKYTPSHGTIRVEVRRLSAEEAAVEVQDTGPGIAPAHHGRIFERFYRVDEGRSRESGGAGLGLATARWAVEVHGGRIELESEEGKGSLFRIVLPVSALAPPA
jgi:signal transduction histidine kinase